jgi:hypothetical protein
MSSKFGKKIGTSTLSKENWQEKKRKLKDKSSNSSDSDLGYAEGKIEKRFIKGIV